MGIGSFFSSMFGRNAPTLPDSAEPDITLMSMGEMAVREPMGESAVLPPLFMTVTNVQRADRTINVEVFYESADGKFEERRVFNFHDLQDDAVGTAVEKVTAELRRVGGQFQATLDVVETKLSSLIGVKVAL